MLVYWYWCQDSKSIIGQTQWPTELLSLEDKESRCQCNSWTPAWDETELCTGAACRVPATNPYEAGHHDLCCAPTCWIVSCAHTGQQAGVWNRDIVSQSRGFREGGLRLKRCKWQASVFSHPWRRSFWPTGSDNSDKVTGGNRSSLQARRKTYILCIIWANKPSPTLIKVITWLGHS